ncbi:MAG: HAMP domain-containing protein, partial [Chloroflexi bacterium]
MEAVNRSPVRLSFGLHGSLAVRLVVTFILFAAVPILAVGVPAAFWTIARTERGALASLEASTVRQAGALEGAVQDWQSAVDALAADPKVAINLQVLMGMVEAYARQEAHDNLVYRLDQFLAGHQDFRDVTIMDLKGKALLSTASHQAGEDLSTASEVRWALGLPVASQAAFHWEPGQLAPVIAVPLRSSLGEVQAIFVAWLADDAVARLLQGAAVTSLPVQTYLFDAEGLVGAVPALESSAMVPFGAPEIVEAALGGESGVARYRNGDGVTMLGAYRWLPTLQMGLLTEVPRRTAVEGVMNAIGRAVGLLYALSWMGLAIAIAVARNISTPLVRLAQAAEQVAQGDLSVRVPGGGKDELGLLVRVFNEMTAQLERSVGALEEEVAARTASLQRRTAQLEATIEVARVAASTLEVGHLLQRVVDLISERFGFYHAGLFLLDEAGEYAVLRAASSEGGQRMLARGHKLKVGEDVVWFDNPDLPHTRSEMALPLKVRG